jgi:hypothetical protein
VNLGKNAEADGRFGRPRETWGEAVPAGGEVVTLRVVTEEQVVSLPISELHQWAWTKSRLGSERIILATSLERIQIEGSELEPIHRLLDALRVRELRVSRGSTRVPGKPWIERIVFEPFPRESRDGRARPPAA